ncbi:alpha-mannosidase [Synechococcus elongatus]|uniref:alpha-mannosidase n=1 Tax=Synechococcus elongatus TaxID=32046 RepID=UPI00003A024D|nr:alpha-mannosidase [Synechococcus elongatus]MBD2687522.1 alpha-mannosidase [Synechococcus elongatus FACHB-1061]AJD57779.1 alpha-mannosidase [Synechococcus elongatus UTEX 2973]MBD2586448.1 alpha-mannosidase [Synechococcus elongatus FACHB-242]MBD2706769.1 alpha-mannosidase [Synechococcus elongatus PCC 7942 = FACHB-805]WKW04696.1 alpha-mannosidase [Synechococcus elongatus PCC 7942 = FACHB-805]
MKADTAAIAALVTLLRRQTEVDLQPHWRLAPATVQAEGCLIAQGFETWSIAERNEKQHIAWPRGQKTLWLACCWTIPDRCDRWPVADMALRLALTWWAEAAEVYVDGQLVQTGDLFDCSSRVLLRDMAQPGDRLQLLLRLVSPGHDDGALVRSQLIFESSTDLPELSFLGQELAVVNSFAEQLQPELLPKLEAIAQSFADLDCSQADTADRLARLRDQLAAIAAPIRQRRVSLLGHAHLDLAWLWPVAETWEAAQRTFESVLQLQAAFPELTFGHSTPALYEWIERNRPDLFVAIQAQIAAGRWEVNAGPWVEPELNLVSAESLVRQLLYGQRYSTETLGVQNRVAWLPDSFGFCWQLPQLLQQAGIDTFVTQKLRWNDSTQFPHGLFRWRSPDGSEVLALMSAPIGTGIDPEAIANYSWEWEQQTGSQESLWLPGVGDHGGGPTRDMLEQARRWQQSPCFPQLQFETLTAYLERLGDRDRLPVWNNELYLEFHRGCYTSHADQKAYNRQAETALYSAEVWASFASLLTGADYPKVNLEAAWKATLFNQFHDILPGSAIPEVYADADPEWQQAIATAHQVKSEALTAIAAHIAWTAPPSSTAQPWLIFNDLPGDRSTVIAIDGHWRIFDLSGQELPSQFTPTETLVAVTVSGMGWLGLWREAAIATIQAIDPTAPLHLSNDWLSAEIDPETGDLLQLRDRQGRELLDGQGNQFQRFQDQGQYWDAWNIDPAYEQHPLPSPELQSLTWLEQGPLRWRLRRILSCDRSTITQDYVLTVADPWLKLETTIDWQQRHELLKVAFPTTVSAPVATYEMAAGAIARPTQPQTPAEAAQWEVPALRWADLSDLQGGLAILNDCKYGYDCRDRQLRLTLLRGSTWPDPQADLGQHQFAYAIYPHPDSWQAAGVAPLARRLNQPLTGQPAPFAQGALQPSQTLLNWNADQLLPLALKRSETGDRWLLRCYEAIGQTAELVLTGDRTWQIGARLDGLEQPLSSSSTEVQPWQIASFELLQPTQEN